MQLTQPDIRPVKENGQLYVLAQPYAFYVSLDMFVIPSGFQYDGATGAKLLFQRDGIHRAACLVHDYLYENKGVVNGHKFNRETVDNIFKDMLGRSGVKNWHVAVSYAAVRLFGWIWWKK